MTLIDGVVGTTPAAETMALALAGVIYAIDLSETNSAEHDAQRPGRRSDPPDTVS